MRDCTFVLRFGLLYYYSEMSVRQMVITMVACLPSDNKG